MKNLFQRTISGIIYLVVIIGALFWGRYAFGLIFLLTGILAMTEYYNLTGIRQNQIVTTSATLTAAVLFILSFLIASQAIEMRFMSFIGLLPAATFIYNLYRPSDRFSTDYSKALLGVVYVMLPLALMQYMAFPDVFSNSYTYRIILGVLILIWMNDTGAYVTGSLFGRTKLFPSVSPNKSWEGFAGGAFFTLLVSVWLHRLMGMLATVDWLIIAIIVSVLGVYGDLVESWLKRSANVKDSGSIIPGHGGILDRIDSVLFVVPAVFFYMMIKGL